MGVERIVVAAPFISTCTWAAENTRPGVNATRAVGACPQGQSDATKRRFSIPKALRHPQRIVRSPTSQPSRTFPTSRLDLSPDLAVLYRETQAVAGCLGSLAELQS